MSYLKSAIKRILPAPSLVQVRAFDYRLHCSDEFRLLAKLCNKNKCSIDVGANLGTLTYHLSRHSSHVFAYEPNPELAAKLRAAFKKRVTVLEVALSDLPGSTELKIPYYRGVQMHGLASIAQDFSDADAVKKHSVQVRRLDDEGYTNVGFVKIDVEQNEERVLRGGMGLFTNERPNILLEVTPKLYSKPLREFLAGLLELGYHAYFLYNRRLLKLEDYRVEIHNRAENYGRQGKYMTNVVLATEPLA
jgi:FkbM family methyltransferase